MADSTNPEFRLAPTRPPNFWEKMEWWHKIILAAGVIIVSVFGAGVGFQRAKASVVFVETQSATDARQDAAIRAVQDDSGRLHVTMDDLHDEVRGMRTDLRLFDPRLRGGNLAPLPEEVPRPTPTADPFPRATSTGTP